MSIKEEILGAPIPSHIVADIELTTKQAGMPMSLKEACLFAILTHKGFSQDETIRIKDNIMADDTITVEGMKGAYILISSKKNSGTHESLSSTQKATKNLRPDMISPFEIVETFSLQGEMKAPDVANKLNTADIGIVFRYLNSYTNLGILAKQGVNFSIVPMNGQQKNEIINELKLQNISVPEDLVTDEMKSFVENALS